MIRTNVMTDRSLSCRTLAMVASALSRVFGVEVVTSGTEAYTAPPRPGQDKFVINIPALDVDDKQYLTLVRGYIDHEVGHVRFTETSFMQDVRMKDALLALWNILEDPYVEYKMGLCYMGCARNLRDLGRAVFTKEELEELYTKCAVPSNLTSVYFNYLLFSVRAMVDPDHFIPLRDFVADVCDQLGGAAIMREIDGVLQKRKYHPTTTTTKDNVVIAKELYKLLKQHTVDNDLSGSPASASSNLPSAVQDLLNQPNIREQVREFMQDELNSTDKVHDSQNTRSMSGYDISQRAANKIKGTMDKLAQSHTVPMPDSDFNGAGRQAHVGRLIGQIDSYDKRRAMDIRAVLDLRLRSLLQSYVMARGGSAACGKLDTHKLHRLAVNNPHVFQHRVEKRGVDTEVIVLVDVSGSMTGNKATMTTQAMYALMTSLSRIKGVRAGAYGFNSDSLPCYVPMGGAVTDQMRICPSGGTLLGEAINACLSRFSYEDGSRQVLIILSDGDSQNPNFVKHMFKRATDIGIEIAAVGILDKYIMEYKDVADCRVINDLKQLPSTLFGILQDKLVAGGLR